MTSLEKYERWYSEKTKGMNAYEEFDAMQKYIIDNEEVRDFYNECPIGHEVVEYRLFNPYLGRYDGTIFMAYELSDEDY